MAGLLGFVHQGDGERALQALCRMAALVTDPESNAWDEPFLDETICATRTHLGLLQPRPQPYRRGQIAVWMEGEIHNADQLDATGAGVDEQGGQPALLARLYESQGRFGTWEALAAADGMFAAVIYDGGSKSVHLVSDRMGLRYLHYTVVPTGLAWASGSNAFLALPGFEAKVAPRRVEQFLGIGHLVHDGTWLEGVTLLAPGTVLTWESDERRLTTHRYWSLGRIARQDPPPPLREAADELARRFRRAVESRWRAPWRVGLTLSGGLDSRAILAAIPAAGSAIETITFGHQDALEVLTARRVAELKGARFHVCELDETNWLAPRIDGVWWTEGLMNILDLHGIEARDVFERLLDVNLNGYGGDTIGRGDSLAGGESLDRFDPAFIASFKHCPVELLDGLDEYAPYDRSDYYILEASARRWVAAPQLWQTAFMEERKPFTANEFVEFAFSLPDTYRYRGRLYYAMLLRAFPEYFRHIAWANTGVPIGWPRGSGGLLRRKHRLERRLRGSISIPGVPGRGQPGYTDYPSWLRVDPARELIERLLLGPDSLLREHDPLGRTTTLWHEHLAGRSDNADKIGRALTCELRLRQLLAGSHRPAPPDARQFAAARRSPARSVPGSR
jgi:asparagine synthase (glutamine-hydrolysing)